MADWNEKFGGLNLGERQEINLDHDLTQSIYWDSINGCSVDGDVYAEGLGAYVDGKISAKFEYGFTLLVRSFGFASAVKPSFHAGTVVRELGFLLTGERVSVFL